MTGKLKAVPIAAAVLAALVVGSVAIAGGPGGHESAGDRYAVSAGSTERAEPADRDGDAAGCDDDAGEADEQVSDRDTFERARHRARGGRPRQGHRDRAHRRGPERLRSRCQALRRQLRRGRTRSRLRRRFVESDDD